MGLVHAPGQERRARCVEDLSVGDEHRAPQRGVGRRGAVGRTVDYDVSADVCAGIRHVARTVVHHIRRNVHPGISGRAARRSGRTPNRTGRAASRAGSPTSGGRCSASRAGSPASGGRCSASRASRAASRAGRTTSRGGLPTSSGRRSANRAGPAAASRGDRRAARSRRRHATSRKSGAGGCSACCGCSRTGAAAGFHGPGGSVAAGARRSIGRRAAPRITAGGDQESCS